MPTATRQIPNGYVSSRWKKLSRSYADSGMLLGADGNPLTNINAYEGHLNFQRIGVRSIDDVEFNEFINTDSDAARQMRQYAIWTSFLKNVQKNAKGGGYTAKHTARPEVSIRDDKYVVRGDSKATKLPENGYFTIRHLLSSDDGLPHETTPGAPNEPFAYWAVAEGKERPVSRGSWDLSERGVQRRCELGAAQLGPGRGRSRS